MTVTDRSCVDTGLGVKTRTAWAESWPCILLALWCWQCLSFPVGKLGITRAAPYPPHGTAVDICWVVVRKGVSSVAGHIVSAM